MMIIVRSIPLHSVGMKPTLRSWVDDPAYGPIDKPDDRSRWLMNLAARRHRNIATVAQANKNVRIAWAILTREQRYRAA
jgi:hypothetical protein